MDDINTKIKEIISNRLEVVVDRYDESIISSKYITKAEDFIYVLLDIENTFKVKISDFFDTDNAFVTIEQLGESVRRCINS